MPWYGMHLIDRVRHQAAETERQQRHNDRSIEQPPSRTELFFEATPTIAVVGVWSMLGAVIYCAATGTSEWDIVLTVAIGPAAMLLAGLGWGSHRSQLSAGFDAAIVTGTVVGALFVIGALLS